MKKQKIVEYLKKLNECEMVTIDGTDIKRLIFKDRKEVFNIFGSEKKGVLNPFNDYTYEWLNSFLSHIVDLFNYNDFTEIREIEESINDLIHEWVDSEVSIYTSDLTLWLSNNNSNVNYLEDAIKEYPTANNHLQLAQYKAIEECFCNAVPVLLKHLKNKFGRKNEITKTR